MSDQERWEKEKEEQQSILKHDMAEEIEGITVRNQRCLNRKQKLGII